MVTKTTSLFIFKGQGEYINRELKWQSMKDWELIDQLSQRFPLSDWALSAPDKLSTISLSQLQIRWTSHVQIS